jgi:hypothetical protein
MSVRMNETIFTFARVRTQAMSHVAIIVIAATIYLHVMHSVSWRIELLGFKFDSSGRSICIYLPLGYLLVLQAPMGMHFHNRHYTQVSS